MSDGQDKRRIPRIPVVCAVVVREKLATWSTDTEDVGARGCRITLKRPLAPGSLVQLRFERGGGAPPLDVVGQVVWATRTPPRSAGVAFVNAPTEVGGAQTRSWIDAMVAAHLRRSLAAWPGEPGTASRLGRVALQLGTPPESSLDPDELAVVRLARSAAPLSAVCGSPDGIRALVDLLDRGVVSVCRSSPDPEGWKRALSLLASSERTARAVVARTAPAVIVPPLPETTWRESGIARMIGEYLETA